MSMSLSVSVSLDTDTDRDMDVDMDMGRTGGHGRGRGHGQIQIGNEKHEQFAVIILHEDYCRRRFVEETFCLETFCYKETFCRGDVLLRRRFVRRRFVEETFCKETFCMCVDCSLSVFCIVPIDSLIFRRLKINHDSHEFILELGTATNSTFMLLPLKGSYVNSEDVSELPLHPLPP
jgi:hypothetical protein